MSILVVTNDFPPRPGGIQTFVHGFVQRLPPDEVVVLTSAWRGAAEFDNAQPFPVRRISGTVLLPTRAVAATAARLAEEHGCGTVWFGALAPLALLTPSLRRRSPIRWAVASTHGHEVGWAKLPGTRQALRRMGNALDVVTVLGDYTQARLSPALGDHPRIERLTGGVDVEAFRPGRDGAAVRQRLGIPPAARVVVCVSRLVPRKGQAQLVRALPEWRRRVPEAHLLLVGGGPDRQSLLDLARSLGVAESVTITGSVPAEELPDHYAAGDVFAMACVSQRGGLEVEGLGLVFLEAAACGLPVVVGRSGGSVDAVVEGVTGVTVDGASLPAVTRAVGDLLAQPDRAAALGAAGRDWVTRTFGWDVLAPRLQALLRPPAAQSDLRLL